MENQGVEGEISAEAELEQEQDAVADAASDLKIAEREDKEDAAAAGELQA